MQPRNPTIKIHFTGLIPSVLTAYKETRPADLEASFVVIDQPKDQQPGEPSSKMGDFIAMAEFGALGGQKGVMAAAGYAFLQKAGDRLCKWWAGNNHEEKIREANGIYYLKETKFEEIKLDEKSIAAKRIKALQKLYDFCCVYQNLKGTRPGIPSLNWGEHRVEDVIDDHKYLVNILIGRKLQAAAKAAHEGNEALYQHQIKHLNQFLEKITSSPEILYSKSNDTTYASLRSVIIAVKKDLLYLDKADKAVSSSDFLNVISSNINGVVSEATRIIETVKEDLTYLMTGTSPASFNLCIENEPVANNLNPCKEIKRSGYLSSILKSLYENKTLTDIELNQIGNGLEKFSGAYDVDLQEIKIAFEVVNQTKNKLVSLLGLFKKLEAIKQKGGQAALTKVINETAFLLREINKTQQDLVQQRHNFDGKLSKIYSNSNKAVFKNQFAARGFNRLPIDQTPIQDSILAIEYLLMNDRETTIENARGELQGEINNFQLDVREKQFVENEINELRDGMTAHSYITRNTNYDAIEEENRRIQKKREKDEAEVNDMLEDWLKIVVKEDEDLPPVAKEQPWYPRLICQKADRDKPQRLKISSLKEKIEEQAEKLDEQEREITELKVDLAKLEDYKAENKKLKNRLRERERESSDEIPLNNDEIQKNNDIKYKIKEHFHLFIEDYIKRNTNSRSIFHFHGKTGINTAFNILGEFDKMIGTIKTEEFNTERALLNALSAQFRGLVVENQSTLTGNYHPHSLKTYLLAFSSYLNQPVGEKNHGDLFTLFSDTILRDDIKAEYLCTFSVKREEGNKMGIRK